ncbi:hypothetical protein BH23BAC4_BH23BAC4_16630 [soil metagenome]
MSEHDPNILNDDPAPYPEPPRSMESIERLPDRPTPPLRGPSPQEEPEVGRGSRFAIILLLVAVGTVAGIVAYRTFDDRSGPRDVLAAAARMADDAERGFETTDPAVAAVYVRDQIDMRIRIPQFNSAELVGVGTQQWVRGAVVPVFFYDDATNTPPVIYALDYRLLDAYSDRLTLSQSVYTRLAEDDYFDVHRTEERHLVVWRDRDNIFIAVTQHDPAEFVADLIRTAPYQTVGPPNPPAQ